MENKFKLGLVAELGTESLIKSKDWAYFMNFFREKGDVVLFDWKDVSSNFIIPRFVLGSKDDLGLVESNEDIRNLADILYVGQLGKIHKKKEDFMSFLNILENFSGIVVNPIETIKGNLSKQYLLDLQKKGISVIPTVDVYINYSIQYLKNLNFPNYGKSIEDIVLKPKVFGEQGNGVIKLSDLKGESEFKDYLKNNGEVIAQPLVNEIYAKGENSYIFTGRNFSHGLNKITGNFKINFCGSSKYVSIKPTKAEMDLCQSVFDVWPTNFGYARLDIIPSEKPLIGEVEMVNPAGYLSETGSFEKYSKNLNKRLNEVYQGKWN